MLCQLSNNLSKGILTKFMDAYKQKTSKLYNYALHVIHWERHEGVIVASLFFIQD